MAALGAAPLPDPLAVAVLLDPGDWVRTERSHRDGKGGRQRPTGADAETKKKIIAEYATTEGDTGSPEVQVRCSATGSLT